jgi:hypothetical protein
VGQPREFDIDQALATATDMFYRRDYEAGGCCENRMELSLLPSKTSRA